MSLCLGTSYFSLTLFLLSSSIFQSNILACYIDKNNCNNKTKKNTKKYHIKCKFFTVPDHKNAGILQDVQATTSKVFPFMNASSLISRKRRRIYYISNQLLINTKHWHAWQPYCNQSKDSTPASAETGTMSSKLKHMVKQVVNQESFHISRTNQSLLMV